MAQAFSLNDVFLHFSEKKLFEGASLSVAEGEKIGVVGQNGAGKSTLLKLISGIEAPDKGSVTMKNGLTYSYLSQDPHLDKDATIVAAVLGSFPIEKEYEAKSILTRLGFTDMDQKCATLSGGQRKRVALASVLFHPTDLMLLDEPTNHIDSDMIEWLEHWLQAYRGTLVMVTHDRYFLDRVCNRIIEVTDGGIDSYSANYEGYLIERAARESMAEASLRKRKSLYAVELEWIRRGARARSTKAKGRIEQFNNLQDSIKQDREVAPPKIASAFSRLGKKILSCENVSKSLGGKELIRDFSYTFLRDDRIGIIGKNGAGKTTLLNMLSGVLAPDQGTIERGETLKIGYFAQHFPEMDEAVKLIDAARNVAPRVYTPDGEMSCAQMLELFMFPSGMHHQEVGRLSGGEKRRLYLLQVLLTAPNLLILDEPTNDLDIDTLNILEDYLDSFQGCVITVTHDRYFLDRVTRRLFALEDSFLTPYEGGYADYLAHRPMPTDDAPKKEQKEKVVQKTAEKKRFTFKEQRDYDTIEATIAALETKSADLAKQIELNSADYVKVSALMAEQEETEQALYEAMERYVYLQDLFESFKKEP